MGEAQLAAAFEHAGLTISSERLAEKQDIYSSTLALIRTASTPGLGETVPATAFKASWD